MGLRPIAYAKVERANVHFLDLRRNPTAQVSIELPLSSCCDPSLSFQGQWTLQLHERNYGITELEGLGVVWASGPIYTDTRVRAILIMKH
jgi:hypothetical protein